jgi:hypothetical protein
VRWSKQSRAGTSVPAFFCRRLIVDSGIGASQIRIGVEPEGANLFIHAMKDDVVPVPSGWPQAAKAFASSPNSVQRSQPRASSQSTIVSA